MVDHYVTIITMVLKIMQILENGDEFVAHLKTKRAINADQSGFDSFTVSTVVPICDISPTHNRSYTC